MGNFLSSEAPAGEASGYLYPDPSDPKLKAQSVIAPGGNWGADAHRCPKYVDGKAEWTDLITSGTPGRETCYANFQATAKEQGDKPWLGTRKVLSDGKPGPYEFITYGEGAKLAEQIGSGLMKLGVAPKSPFGVYSKNRTEWLLAEQGANCYSIPTVAIYDTLGADSVHYVMEHSEMVGAFFESKQLSVVLGAIKKGLPNFKVAISFDEVTEEDKEDYKDVGVDLYPITELYALGKDNIVPHQPPGPDDLHILMYTSGTTGAPKGVMITHRSIVSLLVGLANVMALTSNDVHFSFLPLAHIFERLTQTYCVRWACSVGFFRGVIPELMADVQALRPTYFVAVPRVLTRIYDKIIQGVKAAGGVKEILFNKAFAARDAALKNGEDTPIYNALIFNKLKMALGGRVRFILTGSAPLDPTVHNFLRVCVCPVILQGYGLTETCAGAAISLTTDVELGHVGPPLNVFETKLVSIPDMNYLTTDEQPRGEVCIRGAGIFQGYFKMPEKTKEDIDEEGWFHTGDVGRWNDSGSLSIIDRKKSIFKLAQGEYLAAEYLEQQYGKCEHAGQVFVYGDPFRTYPLAVIVPEEEVVMLWAKANKVSGSFKEICKTPELKALLKAEVVDVHKTYKLKGYELVKDFIVESEVFTVDNELLTPTFKLKRPNATKKYQAALTEMYDKVDAELAARQAKK
ncbi:hypothetical protein SARC_04160 [Sphaeroforma arctica JP610]|uniref:Long-chain-fatty-acid--CoA ligase n=2 Tax=Sphaeroforma arctica TaxID=72019 RepID=A0A0L0G3C3_9EUKA|nr:hypothetical protein SARC_04160 [Sphaeroforma arctica JP610]AGN91199.1 fatty acyl-CoA synthetase [Sphaeroforma arctica]KNC83602.1 hypothetical protein SARC_04160 [Sphaeroforma arctica JP610]|eukprot:XP_014157504.1 hypothetical protein SARC_04160 [Sphaeroforma arctica JP610]